MRLATSVAEVSIAPLDPSLVKGSHGLKVTEHPPVFVGDGPAPPAGALPMTAVQALVSASNFGIPIDENSERKRLHR